MDPVTERARAVRLAIFDVDGVMTDGTLYIGPQGEAFKAFNILDGHGLKMLKVSGIATAIISGRSSDAVARRAEELEIAHVVQGSSDKSAAFDKLLASLGVQAGACAFMGDDLPDLAGDAPLRVRRGGGQCARRGEVGSALRDARLGRARGRARILRPRAPGESGALRGRG